MGKNDPQKQAVYMRDWSRRNRQRLRERLQRATIAMQSDPRVGTECPCSRCGRSMVLTAARLARCHILCWTCRNGTRNAGYKKRYRAAHPEKVRAHDVVYKAIKSGRLVRQPCESCGSDSGQAHHDDYSKPLEVRWVCKKCHEAEHHPHLRQDR